MTLLGEHEPLGIALVKNGILVRGYVPRGLVTTQKLEALFAHDLEARHLLTLPSLVLSSAAQRALTSADAGAQAKYILVLHDGRRALLTWMAPHIDRCFESPVARDTVSRPEGIVLALTYCSATGVRVQRDWVYGPAVSSGGMIITAHAPRLPIGSVAPWARRPRATDDLDADLAAYNHQAQTRIAR